MKRLRKQALKKQARQIKANKEVSSLLDKINNQIEVLKQDYFVLLDNFNTLFETYGDVYIQVEETVKLPTKQDIEKLVEMQKNMQEITEHLNDEVYLENYIDDSEDLNGEE